MPRGERSATPQPPLCVDLDGTLVKTDLLQEGLVELIKSRPWLVLLFPLWITRGRAYFKQQVAQRAPLAPAQLPYSPSFLAYLQKQHATGRCLILTTGAPANYAQTVADYLGVFTDVLSSDGQTNLIGSKKLARIQDEIENGVFDYAGNAGVDLSLWNACRDALVVNAGRSVQARVNKSARIAETFRDRGSTGKALLKAIRPHQWLKNVLLFVPAVAAHTIVQTGPLLSILLGFIGFSAVASAGYIFNDVLDATSDRLHPGKRLRPFAYGDLYPSAALALIPALLLIAALVSLPLSPTFGIVLAGYFFINLLYTFWLKRKVVVDVFVLAGLYTLRIFAGAAAAAMAVSSWLLAFSVFLFFSLALVKRYAELFPLVQNHTASEKLSGRGYRASDAGFVQMAGLASGFTADLILALYLNSPAVKGLYTHPQLLWGLCALVLYWITRVWFVTSRGGMFDDPIVYAIRDRVSVAVGLSCALVIWLAS